MKTIIKDAIEAIVQVVIFVFSFAALAFVLAIMFKTTVLAWGFGWNLLK